MMLDNYRILKEKKVQNEVFWLCGNKIDPIDVNISVCVCLLMHRFTQTLHELIQPEGSSQMRANFVTLYIFRSLSCVSETNV